MIKNDQQMTVALGKIDGLKARLERLERKYLDKEEFQFYAEATQAQLEQMERELEYYQNAKQGHIDKLLDIWNQRGSLRPGPDTDLTLGEFIALMRVAHGFTQQQLAEQIGIAQANMACYERSDYANYSIDTLERIFEVLGLRLTLGKRSVERAA